jgi:uncharacterized coiled-coil DUF342 family protein
MTDQEKKKELTEKLTQKLVSYQTEIDQLQTKINEYKVRYAETEEELKKLKEEKEDEAKKTKDNDAEIIGMLEKALAETVKIDTKLSSVKSSIELPPKSS